jgi:hypothetical protein
MDLLTYVLAKKMIKNLGKEEDPGSERPNPDEGNDNEILEGTWYNVSNPGYWLMFMDIPTDDSVLISQTILGDVEQVIIKKATFDYVGDFIVDGDYIDREHYSLYLTGETKQLVSVTNNTHTDPGGTVWNYKEFTLNLFATLEYQNKVISTTIPFTVTFGYGDFSQNGTTCLGVTGFGMEWMQDGYHLSGALAGGYPNCELSLLINN